MAIEAGHIYIDITANASKAKSDLALVNKEIKQVDRSTDKLTASTSNYRRASSGALTAARTAWLGVAAAVAVGVMAFGRIMAATRTQIEADTRLQAVLRSTGQAAGLAYEELKQMASGLQAVTTYGDEAIQGAQALLLTFTSIGRDVFPQALESILNVSTAMGQDLRTSTQQLGRALNDPIRGLGALSRVGIQFTEQQREQIRVMQTAGNIAGAQAVIIGELETQFGGMARAMAKTPFGQMEQLKNILGDIAEEVGNEMVPGFGELAVAMRDSATQGGFVKEAFKGIGSLFGGIASELANMVKQLNAVSNFDFASLAESMINVSPFLSAERRSELMTFVQNARNAQNGLGFGSLGTDQGVLPGAGGGGGGGVRPTGAGGGGGGGELAQTEKQLLQAKQLLYDEDFANYQDLLNQKAELDRTANEERLAQMKETFEAVSSVASNIIGSIGEIFKMAAQNEISEVENTYKRRADLIRANVKDEDKRAEMLTALEEEKAQKILKIKREAAKQQKVISIFAATVDTARAVVGTLASLTPINPFLAMATAAAVGALGAVQIGLIANQPLPTAQMGGSFEVAPGYNMDSGLLRVNSGETIDVTSAKDTTDEKNIYISIDGYQMRGYMSDTINSIANSGELQIRKKGAIKTA